MLTFMFVMSVACLSCDLGGFQAQRPALLGSKTNQRSLSARTAYLRIVVPALLASHSTSGKTTDV